MLVGREINHGFGFSILISLTEGSSKSAGATTHVCVFRADFLKVKRLGRCAVGRIQ